MAFHPITRTTVSSFVDYVDRSGIIQVARYAVVIQSEVADPGSAQVHSVDPSSNLLQSLRRPRPVRPRMAISTIGVGDVAVPGDPSGNGQAPDTLMGKISGSMSKAGAPYVVPGQQSIRGSATRKTGDLGVRSPQPVALLIRRRDRRPLHRGCRTGPLGGSGRAAGGEWRRRELRLEYSRRRSLLQPAERLQYRGLVMPTFEYSHGVNDANGCSIIGGARVIGASVYQSSSDAISLRRSLRRLGEELFRLQGGVAVDLHDYTPEFGGLSLIHLLRRG